MSMLIQHNLMAMNTNRMRKLNASTIKKSSEKLASGYRINRAADDAAGLAISEKMRHQIRGLAQASVNAQDGVSMVQTAEGALNEVHEMLHRMTELAVQAANGTNQDEDREYLDMEFSQIKEEIDRTVNNTTFNDIGLLDGSCTSVNIHVGTKEDSTITLQLSSMTAANIGVGGNSVLSSTNARNALTTIPLAVKSVSTLRAHLGAVQNRLEHTINNLDNVVENTQASESVIRDTDMASEMVTYSNNQILAQAVQAMLTQANQSNQGVLSLLQ